MNCIRFTGKCFRPVTKAILIFAITLLPSYSIAADTLRVNLQQAISIALENSKLEPLAKKSVEIAEAQYQQAVSAYWPSLSFNARFQRMDEKPSFEFPSTSLDLDLGFPTAPIEIPQQDIDLLGRETTQYSLELIYPLYTGGKRESLSSQAEINVDMAQIEVRKSRLKVMQDVKRYYYAGLYTLQLKELAEDVVLTLDVLNELTRAFWEGGSTAVSKLDVLQIKLAHSLALSTLLEIEKKHKLALSALVFAMGLEWDRQVEIVEIDYPEIVPRKDLNYHIEQAREFNPDIEQVRLAVQLFDEKVEEYRSENKPVIALFASLDGLDSDVGGGLYNETNEESWTIGIGLKLNLFDGGQVRNLVKASRLEKDKMSLNHALLTDGLTAQVKSLFLDLEASMNGLGVAEDSAQVSKQSLELHDRAYQAGSVQTQSVIEAVLVDAFVRSNLYRIKHEIARKESEIAFLLGKDFMGE